MLKGTYYEVEIEHPTNSGEYSTKILFDNEKEANDFIDNYLDNDYDGVEELERNEWDSYGPNWEPIKILVVEDEVIYLNKINNDYAEESN